MSRTLTDLDHTLIALADPTRRAILQRLTKGEARVTELAEPFAISLNSVSKHIRMLERARLVRRRQVGRAHFLTLNQKPLDSASKWLTSQQKTWETRLLKADAKAQKSAASAAKATAPASAAKAPAAAAGRQAAPSKKGARRK